MEFNIKVNEMQLQIVLQALSQLPYFQSVQTIDVIANQADAQKMAMSPKFKLIGIESNSLKPVVIAESYNKGDLLDLSGKQTGYAGYEIEEWQNEVKVKSDNIDWG